MEAPPPPPPKSQSSSQANLFQVYLRLRPAPLNASNPERFLLVEEPAESETPTHITLNPPNDRRRAIEKFAFTQVFQEDATQLDLFQGTHVLPLVEGALAPHGGDGTDGLLATLGVTGSGKTHTMLGSKTERGMTQLALDVVFRSIEANIVDCTTQTTLEASIKATDASEASILSAPAFLETVYSDFAASARASRSATPMVVRNPPQKEFIRFSLQKAFPELPGMFPESHRAGHFVHREDETSNDATPSTPPSERCKSKLLFDQEKIAFRLPKLAHKSPSKKHYMSLTSAAKTRKEIKSNTFTLKGDNAPPPTPRARMQRPSAMPQTPDINSIRASCDASSEYAVLISMYEVYNDRIFDLLTPPIRSNATKEYRRRPLLFKPTEQSPDRKLVAGLRKIICGSLKESLMVLEAGLQERRVAGTGSNSVSSRSHGFFCVEIKKRRRGRTNGAWEGSTISIVDLAGSERARDAKTQGATLAEAGKINESLMYLGQCLQMQSDIGNASKPNLVPFRQCKLTELLFSNSFPSSSLSQSHSRRRPPQKAVMIVTADPLGDFNATSQILRYSALAREITVPRVPSITQTILQTQQLSYPNLPLSQYSPSSSPPLPSPMSTQRSYFKTNIFSPKNGSRVFSPASDSERATMENAALEIARMAEVIDQLNAELSRETEARMTAEAHLMSIEDRMLDLEQDIREECYSDFEQRLALEMARWKVSMSLEQERGEEHWDKKVEVLARSVGVTVTAPSDGADTEDEDKENVLIENLEQENDRLRRELAVLKKELGTRTPSKRAPLSERGDFSGVKSEMTGLGNKMEELRVTDIGTEGKGSPRKSKIVNTGSPTKKVRKLAAKKWESVEADDDLF